MSEFNSILEGLAKAITEFKCDEKKWVIVLNNGSDTYNKDFSVLLKQNIVNTLFEIHESKEKILTAALALITVASKKKSNLSSITLLAIENIRENAQSIASMELQKIIIDYSIKVNKIIDFFKSPEGQIYENQVSEAKKILDLWNKLLFVVAEITKKIHEIEKDVLLIAKNFDF